MYDGLAQNRFWANLWGSTFVVPKLQGSWPFLSDESAGFLEVFNWGVGQDPSRCSPHVSPVGPKLCWPKTHLAQDAVGDRDSGIVKSLSAHMQQIVSQAV